MRPNYQLTEHPVGTLREIWAVSWPLMLSLCSSSLMIFADRLYLAHYSLAAMNAVTVAGAFCFVVMAFPLTISEITGVFVGRFHGQGQNERVGRPVWQIVWLAMLAWPIFFLVSRLISPLLFAPESLESIYFVRYLDFSPFLLSSFAVMGFFLGIGKTKVITLSTVSANVMNAILAPICIFGTPYTPSMGIEGAAYATGASQCFQLLFLLLLFLRKTHRETYKTHKCHFELSLTREMLTVGVPSGVGRAAEGIAHGLFFRIIAMAGAVELTCATIAQSFYMLVVFCVYGISKGVTAVISNLVGAKEDRLIPQAINSALKVHSILFCLLLVISLSCCEMILGHILNAEDVQLFQGPEFRTSVKMTLVCMSFFFLLKGFSWIMVGHLTALGDTKFVMYVNAITHWIGYILPIYMVVGLAECGAVAGWTVVALNSLLVFAIFWRRSSNSYKLSSIQL